MGVDSHFIHTCTIERPENRADPYGEPIETWIPLATAVRCRLVINVQRVAPSAFAESPVMTKSKLLLAANTDIQQGDRITAVRDERGVVDDTIWTIQAVLPRRANAQRHVTVLVEQNNGRSQ